jgi:hypothetical protein
MPRYLVKTSERKKTLLGDEFALRPTSGPNAVTRDRAIAHCDWLIEHVDGGTLKFVELYEDGVLIRRIEHHNILPEEVNT